MMTTDQLVARVDFGAADGCWEWTGAKTGRNYGRILRGDGTSAGAHRVFYELFVEAIPEGLVIDHLCRNTVCVNPDHLEAVTSRENTLRGKSPSVISYLTGVCRRGHSMDDAIINNRATGNRKCRTCANSARRGSS